MHKTILAIHAHPDDIEILAAGTLAQLSAAGHEVVIVSMTPGDCGARDCAPEEIAAIRRNEAAAAARHIGAIYRCAEFRDLAIFNDDASRRRVTELLRGVRPDVVLTAPPVDYMCDHEATSALVRDACFGASAPNYATSAASPAAALCAVPHLYFMDPIGGVDRENRPVMADFYVDIGPQFETKRAMLAEHASQREWLLAQHGIDDYLLAMERWTRQMGQRAGVLYAEGFRQYKGHPYPATPLLEELLGHAIRRPAHAAPG
ncbi:MAG TPA: PIG-L family deacetylase [Bryobacteraceae bacterium]|jgi:LmbE family N-acetylglucosaminyl deacetylase|nr:PIG-L family deacetylase [Bryobacteraceae bacterium]